MVEKKVEKNASELCQKTIHTHQSLTAYPIAVNVVKLVLDNAQIEVKGGLNKK